MITVFNRKELLTTQDVDRYANAKDDLKNSGIEFLPKVKGVYGMPPRSAGRLQMKKRLVSEYTVYVHEKDYNCAIAVISQK